MHDAMTDRYQVRITRIGLQPIEQKLETTSVLRGLPLVPFVLSDDAAIRVFGAKASASIEFFQIAADAYLQ